MCICYASLCLRGHRGVPFFRTRIPIPMEVKTTMPNAKVLSEKQAIVAELTEKIQKATAGVIVDYKGITVEEDTALRRECVRTRWITPLSKTRCSASLSTTPV